MNKIKIAIDLDDTLVPTVELLVKEMFKDKSFPAFRGYQSIKDFTYEEEVALYQYIRQTLNKQEIAEFKPISGSVSAIKKLSKDFELYILTARNTDIKNHTQTWVKHHYPKIFKDIIFSKYVIEGKFVKTKGEICKEMGISLIVDDNLEYITDCDKHGIKTILFDYKGNYGWSKGKAPKKTKLANTWKEVFEIIKKTKF